MIELKNLSAGYPGAPVLRGINACIRPGELTVLIGPNGCGKSTLLRAVLGLTPERSGEILLSGQDASRLSPRELARQAAFLSQSRQLPEISVQRMVLHGRFPYLGYPRRYGAKDLAAAREAMERLGIGHLAEKPLAALSGGERQKVYIAMALAQDTPILLMDEPTSFLDISWQLRLLQLARELADEGRTVLMVLHDLALALRRADRLLVMDRGELLMQDTPEEFFASGLPGRVFDVKLCRFPTESGWQYYYDGHAGQGGTGI